MKKLTEQEIEDNLEVLVGWEFRDEALHTTLEFENFKECFSVMTRIAFEAEAQNHHPDWTNVYNELSISLSTHEAGGVTDKDLKLAHSIEEIINAQ